MGEELPREASNAVQALSLALAQTTQMYARLLAEAEAREIVLRTGTEHMAQALAKSQGEIDSQTKLVAKLRKEIEELRQFKPRTIDE